MVDQNVQAIMDEEAHMEGNHILILLLSTSRTRMLTSVWQSSAGKLPPLSALSWQAADVIALVLAPCNVVDEIQQSAPCLSAGHGHHVCVQWQLHNFENTRLP